MLILLQGDWKEINLQVPGSFHCQSISTSHPQGGKGHLTPPWIRGTGRPPCPIPSPRLSWGQPLLRCSPVRAPEPDGSSHGHEVKGTLKRGRRAAGRAHWVTWCSRQERRGHLGAAGPRLCATRGRAGSRSLRSVGSRDGAGGRECGRAGPRSCARR